MKKLIDNSFKKGIKIQGFTLVELIIVITILAILATIAFISFQDYTKDARDANRVSTIKSVEKWLELFTLQTNKYPEPDEPTIFTWWVEWKTKIKQWIIWDNVSKIIKMSNIPVDTKDNTNYVYSTFWDDSKYYQIAINSENAEMIFIPKTYASTSSSAIVKWNYKFDPSLPSLILVKESVTWSWIFDLKVCFVIDGWENTITSNPWDCIKKGEMSLKNFDNSLVGYWDMETCTWSELVCWEWDKLKDLSWNGNDGIFSGITLPTSTWWYLWKGLSFSWWYINLWETNTWSIFDFNWKKNLSIISIINYNNIYDNGWGNTIISSTDLDGFAQRIWDNFLYSDFRILWNTSVLKAEYVTKSNNYYQLTSTYDGDSIKSYINWKIIFEKK